MGQVQRLTAAAFAEGAPLGAKDPEATISEVLERAMKNPLASRALNFYYRDDPIGAPPHDWSPGRLTGWLMTALTWIVKEEHREAARGGISLSLTRTSDEKEIDLPSKEPDPWEQIARREQRAKLDRCLARLRDEERRALLDYGDGFSYAQIALKLGRNEDTVASWIRRGRIALKECLRLQEIRP